MRSARPLSSLPPVSPSRYCDSHGAISFISALADAEVCVSDLVAELGMGQSSVSHQLRSLRELRLVATRRAGKHVFYRLADDHVARLFAQGLEHVTDG